MVRTLSLLSLVMLLYIICRTILPLRVRWWWKVLLALLLVPAAFKFAVLRLLNPDGSYFVPEVPAAVLLPFTWLNICFLIFCVFLLAAEPLKLLVWSASRMHGCRMEKGWHLFRNALHVLVLAAAMLCTTLGMHNALLQPEVTEWTVELEDMPADARPVKMALLADLHADVLKRAPFFEELVQRTNALNADIIALAGDYVDGRLEKYGEDLRPLAKLHAPMGVYAVSGNHDIYSDYSEWGPYLSTLGITMLNNAHVAPPNAGLVVAGVTDISAESHGEEPTDLPRALQGAPAGLPVVLLAHQPRFAPVSAENGVAVMLAGHTHGGMARGFDKVVAASNSGYVAGAYQVKNMQLYVSRGTNLWSGMLLRLGVPSEITLITFKPKAR